MKEKKSNIIHTHNGITDKQMRDHDLPFSAFESEIVDFGHMLMGTSATVEFIKNHDTPFKTKPDGSLDIQLGCNCTNFKYDPETKRLSVTYINSGLSKKNVIVDPNTGKTSVDIDTTVNSDRIVKTVLVNLHHPHPNVTNVYNTLRITGIVHRSAAARQQYREDIATNKIKPL